MGRCHEFGLQIRDGCGHAMVAGKSSCSCAECRVVCGGRFAGCPDVWARGPQPATLTLNSDEQPAPPLKRIANGAAVVPATMSAKPDTPRVEAVAVKTASAEPLAVSVSTAGATAPAPPVAAVAKASAQAAKKPAPTIREAPTVHATVPDDTPVTVPEPMPTTQATVGSPNSQAPASAAALRWLEGAFAGLRAELQSLRGHLNQQQATMAELVNGITQQQALLSELLEARDADFRLAETAEALPQFVSDAVAHEVRANRERTVAAIASTLETKLAEANIGEPPRLQQLERDLAELRAFLENDPATGSIVAAISTEAATRAVRAEFAEQLPKVLDQALSSSDARMDEMVERMDKLVTRAIRVGARAATAEANDSGLKASARGRAAATSGASAAKVAAKPAKASRGITKAQSRPTRSRAAAAPKVVKASNSTKSVKAAKTEPRKRAAAFTSKRPAKPRATKPAAAKAAKVSITKAAVTKGSRTNPQSTKRQSTKPQSPAKRPNGRISKA